MNDWMFKCHLCDTNVWPGGQTYVMIDGRWQGVCKECAKDAQYTYKL